jgi:hypothetical protein
MDIYSCKSGSSGTECSCTRGPPFPPGSSGADRRVSDGLNVARPFKAGDDVREQCPRRVSDD